MHDLSTWFLKRESHIGDNCGPQAIKVYCITGYNLLRGIIWMQWVLNVCVLYSQQWSPTASAVAFTAASAAPAAVAAPADVAAPAA